MKNLLTVCLKVLTPRGASGTSKRAFIVNPASLEVIWDLPHSVGGGQEKNIVKVRFKNSPAHSLWSSASQNKTTFYQIASVSREDGLISLHIGADEDKGGERGGKNRYGAFSSHVRRRYGAVLVCCDYLKYRVKEHIVSTS